jgi:hypothetical protein
MKRPKTINMTSKKIRRERQFRQKGRMSSKARMMHWLTNLDLKAWWLLSRRRKRKPRREGSILLQRYRLLFQRKIRFAGDRRFNRNGGNPISSEGIEMTFSMMMMRGSKASITNWLRRSRTSSEKRHLSKRITLFVLLTQKRISSGRSKSFRDITRQINWEIPLRKLKWSGKSFRLKYKSSKSTMPLSIRRSKDLPTLPNQES